MEIAQICYNIVLLYGFVSLLHSLINTVSDIINKRVVENAKVKKSRIFNWLKGSDKSYVEIRKMNEKLRKKYRKTFIVCDILVVIAVLFNFSALIMTNALVVKLNTEGFISGDVEALELREANPVRCIWNGWACHEEGLLTMWDILIQIWVIAFIFSYYLRYRQFAKNEYDVLSVMMLACLMFYVLGFDFFHDLGYYLGFILWRPIG